MSREFWEEFFAHTYVSLEAHELSMEMMTTTNLAEDLSLEVIISDAPGPQISSTKVTFVVPPMLRLPRPKQSMAKEKKPAEKEK